VQELVQELVQVQLVRAVQRRARNQSECTDHAYRTMGVGRGREWRHGHYSSLCTSSA
jgi:hypothetical protein